MASTAEINSQRGPGLQAARFFPGDLKNSSQRETAMIKSSFIERNLRIIFPLPALVFIFLLMIFPVFYTLFISFTDWSLTSGRPMKFAGFGSYITILKEPRFRAALLRTFIFTFGAVISETVAGTAIALVLNREFKAKNAMVVLLLPLVATPVQCIVWNLFYDPTIGFLNYVLSLLKLPQSGWVTESKTVLQSLILVDIWQWTPMITLIVLAGLAGLSTEPYESAKWTEQARFRHLCL